MTAPSRPARGLARSLLAAKSARALLPGFMLLGIAVGAVLAGSPAAHAATSARANFGAAWQTVDCKTFDVPAAVAAMSDCGYVTAPEQHALPKGRTIQLAVVRIRSTSKRPAADPLFVEQGGPGDSTIGVIVDWAVPSLPELQYVIAQADKHKAKLRSVIIDGVVRPDIDFNLAAGHSLSYALRNLFHACAQDQACGQAYPRLEQKFLAIVDHLNQKPVALTLTTPLSKQAVVTQVDGNAFATALLSALIRPYSGNSARGTSIPKNIQAASQGNFSWVADNLSTDLESSDGSAKGMYHSVLCARAKTVQATPTQVLPPAYPPLMAWGTREGETVVKVCAILQADLKPPFVYENTDIPTLVLSGAYDPVTPQPYGEAVGRNLKNAYVYSFPGLGHGSFFPPPGMPATDCVIQIATDFLAKPRQAPNSSCLTQIKPLFVVE
jgi:pimeloyl-ACP methyl ester carboxylesterase